MRWLLGQDALGIVPLILGGAVLAFSVLVAIGGFLGLVLSGRISREEESER